MSRMKTFFIYLLIFVAFYFVSKFLISGYIKTSYYKINSYDINIKEANVTIISAKASKDGGHIEGKIYNNTNENIQKKYMKVELFSNNNVNVGTEYIFIENLSTGSIKNFKIDFKIGNVNSFKISLVSQEEKQQAEQEEKENEENNRIVKFEPNNTVEEVFNQMSVR